MKFRDSLCNLSFRLRPAQQRAQSVLCSLLGLSGKLIVPQFESTWPSPWGVSPSSMTTFPFPAETNHTLRSSLIWLSVKVLDFGQKYTTSNRFPVRLKNLNQPYRRPIMQDSSIQRFKDFRHQLHSSFQKRRDAVMELIDAITGNSNNSKSPACLSLSALFSRGYSSIYYAVNDFFSTRQIRLLLC